MIRATDDIQRFPRLARERFELPRRADGHPLRVTIVYAVVYRFRVPIFRRLTQNAALDVNLLVGSGMPGDKMVNAPDVSGLSVTRTFTLRRMVRSSGRRVPLLFNPTHVFHLIARNPDVIVVQGGEALNNLFVLLYAKLFNKPIVWWSLGALRGRKFSKAGGLYRRLVQWLERRATTYLGYSSVAIQYFRAMGYPTDRCFNLVNVVDTDLVKQRIEDSRIDVEPLRDRLGLRDRRVVLYVGAMTETKNVPRLIRAFAAVTAQMDDTRLVLVGDGPTRAASEALATELGIGERVQFIGAVFERVSAYFLMADLLVTPGTGGLVVSEAMTHGLPVISAIGDGAEVDLIEEGRNGFVVTADGVEALVEPMTFCLADADRLAEMGRRSREIIDQTHNIDAYMNEMLAGISLAYRLHNRHVDDQSIAREQP